MSEKVNKQEAQSSRQINFKIIVCSSSLYERFRQDEKFIDASGDLILKLITDAGHNVVSIQFLPDDQVLLAKEVGNAISTKLIDAIIVCGGTGLGLSEITLEVLRPLMVKTMPGFAELFRKLSYEKFGSKAITTRALAGITDQQKILFCIPISLSLVELAMNKLILPEIGQILELTKEH